MHQIMNTINYKHTCYCCNQQFNFETKLFSGQWSNGLYQVDGQAEATSINVAFVGEGILEVDVICPNCENTNRIKLDIPQA